MRGYLSFKVEFIFNIINLFKPHLFNKKMALRIHTIGGYNEVGKNMTALEIDDDVILFDDGLFLPAIVGVAEREKNPTEKGMRNLGALPDDLYLEKKGLKNKVRAIIPSHAHLDHIGAIPYNAYRYKADIIGTPYTTEVLKVLMKDNGQSLRNKIITVTPNNSYIVRGRRSYKVEFINITHSTIQSAVIAVHTPKGIILYANDYKLDNSPIFGDKPNYKRLKELSRIGIKALIVDCLYAPDDRKTPSEKIAKGLLEDVFLSVEHNAGMVITTFSSHIARLKTITELGRRINREVIFCGRSLSKYVTAARNIGKAPFIKDIKLISYRRQLEKMLSRINKEKSRYLLVCTGHQGEPGSILERLARHQLPLKLGEEDQVIFSSKTIPTPINEVNKEQLIKKLKAHKIGIFDSVHVSGHGGAEDLRELIKLTNPENIIPSHGDLKKTMAGAKLAEELGYKIGKNVHVMQNHSSLNL